MIIFADAAMQNIVLVGGNHQLFDRQAHFVRQITGKDIAKVTGWHRERNFALRATQ